VFFVALPVNPQCCDLRLKGSPIDVFRSSKFLLLEVLHRPLPCPLRSHSQSAPRPPARLGRRSAPISGLRPRGVVPAALGGRGYLRVVNLNCNVCSDARVPPRATPQRGDKDGTWLDRAVI